MQEWRQKRKRLGNRPCGISSDACSGVRWSQLRLTEWCRPSRLWLNRDSLVLYGSSEMWGNLTVVWNEHPTLLLSSIAQTEDEAISSDSTKRGRSTLNSFVACFRVTFVEPENKDYWIQVYFPEGSLKQSDAHQPEINSFPIWIPLKRCHPLKYLNGVFLTWTQMIERIGPLEIMRYISNCS